MTLATMVAQVVADPAVAGMAVGSAGIGSFIGSFIGSAVGAWNAVRKQWDAEARAAVAELVDNKVRDHAMNCRSAPPREVAK